MSPRNQLSVRCIFIRRVTHAQDTIAELLCRHANPLIAYAASEQHCFYIELGLTVREVIR